MPTILTNTCARIPVIARVTLFTHTLAFIIIPFWFKLHVVLPYLHLQSHEICFNNVFLNISSFDMKYFNIYVFWFTRNIFFFVDQSSAALQLNRISIIYGSLFNDTHLVAEDALKLNNLIYFFKINSNIILYYFLTIKNLYIIKISDLSIAL